MGTKPKAAAAPAKTAADTRHIIFLVHGMGKYGAYKTVDKKKVYTIDTDGWFDAAEKELATIHDTIVAPACQIPSKFDQSFRVVRVEYDSVFEQFRLDWAYQAGQWEKLFGDLGAMEARNSWIVGLRDFLKGATDDTFGWTHIADVLMYCLPTVRNQIANHVAAQIAGTLRDTKALGGWSIIAHSLGTAVVHDTYPDMIGSVIADIKKLSGPRVVCSVSNFARLLTDHKPDAYHKLMSPLPTPGEPRPQRYIECRHELDFLAHVDPFEPKTWRTDQGYRFSELTDLDDFYWKANFKDWKNAAKEAAILPHEFWHYMRQPPLAGQLWGSLLQRRPDAALIAEAMKKEMDAFNDEGRKAALNTIVEAAIDKVKLGPELTPKVVVSTLINFLSGS